jgi:SAM-dependent methyltransferase
MVSFTERYTDGAYLEHAPDWHAGDAEWKAGKVFEMIERHRLQPSSVCDVGCGAGEVLARLRRRMSASTTFCGFDISPQAIALARAKAAANLTFENLDFSRDTSQVFDHRNAGGCRESGAPERTGFGATEDAQQNAPRCARQGATDVAGCV